jgi:hypothetical protein
MTESSKEEIKCNCQKLRPVAVSGKSDDKRALVPRLYKLVHGEIMENKMTSNRRWVICIGCIVLFLSGYFGSQLTTSSAQANSLDATTSTTNNSQLLMSSTDLETGKQITIIDVKSKAISVYLIERGTGKIQLLSTRNAHWDFQLDEYNSGNPTPREIQQLINQ